MQGLAVQQKLQKNNLYGIIYSKVENESEVTIKEEIPLKICILDGYTTNPGDVSWAPLEALGELTIYDFTEPEEIVTRAKNCEILITNKTVLNAQTIAALPKLQYIGTLSTGFNVVDCDAAKQRGIPVCNVPTYCTEAVAQFTFAMLFAITNRIETHSQSVHNGDWANSRHFCYWNSDLIDVAGSTLGIIGFGNIGRAVAKIALALEMNVLVYSRTPKEMPQGCKQVEFQELLANSDVVTIHCPLTQQTERMINREALQCMKPTAILLNTARGQVIDEQALADALNTGRLYAAGLDVLSQEPPEADNPLLTAKNCMITPHIAWASKEARTRLIGVAAENIRAFLNGNAQNNVAK